MVKSGHSNGEYKTKRAEKSHRKGDKEQEMTIDHEMAPITKKKETWSWYEALPFEWSEAFITKKGKKHSRKGEQYENLCGKFII
jgi:hypothetical protein